MTKYPPVNNLMDLIDYQANGYEPPKDLQDWLLQVWEHWQSGQSLKDAFQIADSQAERRERRNIELCKYAAMLGNRSIWMKAKIIGQEVKKIRQGRRDCDEQLKAIDKIAKIPGSRKQIIRILQGENRDI
ncbi:MAG: hypothetical protein WCP01_02045 [Methylococcaceae bacterium]